MRRRGHARQLISFRLVVTGSEAREADDTTTSMAIKETSGFTFDGGSSQQVREAHSVQQEPFSFGEVQQAHQSLTGDGDNDQTDSDDEKEARKKSFQFQNTFRVPSSKKVRLNQQGSAAPAAGNYEEEDSDVDLPRANPMMDDDEDDRVETFGRGMGAEEARPWQPNMPGFGQIVRNDHAQFSDEEGDDDEGERAAGRFGF